MIHGSTGAAGTCLTLNLLKFSDTGADLVFENELQIFLRLTC